MAASRMSSKGQLTVPASVRNEMGAAEGTRIEFIPLGDGRFEIVAASSPVQALKGMIKRPSTPVTVEDMKQAIAAEASRRK